MIEKQQQLTFNKGITNVPSDALCNDGELSVCNGLTAENGELKPIQDPSTVSDAPNKKILLVHDGRYLFQSASTIYYNSTSNPVMTISGDLVDITTVGNTVIASTTTGTYYSLWEGASYTPLGSKIPEPDVELRLEQDGVSSRQIYFEDLVDSSGVLTQHQQEFNDIVWGAMRSMEKRANEDGLFVYPFVARVAVELYDGSYTLHSAPQIMLPWYKGNVYLLSTTEMNNRGDLHITKSMLVYRINNQNTDYAKWKDIVKNITVFVSRPHTIFLEEADYELIPRPTGGSDYNINCGYYIDLGAGNRSVVTNIGNGAGFFYSVYPDPSINRLIDRYDECRLILHGKDDITLISELKEESVFFKLCDIGLESTGGYYKTAKGLLPSYVIQNIETQMRLPNEDYHSHDTYLNGNLYSYNGRLHMSNVKRYLFGGFKGNIFGWDTSSSYDYTIYVKINTNEGDKWVYTSTGSIYEGIGAFYFFYPDSRATEARIFSGGSLRRTLTLTEHPGTNGAYWVSSSLPTNTYASLPSAQSGNTPSPLNFIEMLNDTLMVSEVDNPMLFLSKGFVTVGNGNILGVAAVTMALNEYQHGRTPLVAFCSDGIYSLAVNQEGYYDATQAVSREVCLNRKTISQVDMGIFFVSKKGLMYLDTSGVKCVSPQMKGTNFDKFIDSCIMAYDYRDSLLYIYSTENSNFHYIYNMKTGTFSTRDGSCDNVVNNYPDTLIQMLSGTTWNTYSLLNKPDEQDDPGENTQGSYAGIIETRPMKLENALALKSILQVRHIHALSSTAGLSFKIFASNNLDKASNTWVQLTSLRGKPWKYYKFQYDFSNLKATDRFAGTMVITQERRTDKLR